MWFSRRLAGLRQVYQEYPRQFWNLVGGMFIDRVGGALLFPFFTLYITRRFGVGMTEVGLLFGLFALSGFAGNMLGGALTDRLGRKGVVLFGLVMSALSALGMGLVDDLRAFAAVAVLVGLLADVAGPATQAMIADLLPEEKRAGGFGVMRVIANLAVVIGPMIGGLLAARSYLLLFVLDAVASLITAVILNFSLAESKPAEPEGQAAGSMFQTFAGYRDVLRNRAFVWFLVASALSVVVYMQMNTTLSVYLRDVHGVPEQGYGYILSLNAAMVVLFQFPIARWTQQFRPLLVIATGTLLFAVGFALYGLVSIYLLFLGAMVIITLGEMAIMPVSQAVVARLAPADMRGRYMAVYGLSWLVPMAVGPLLAGMVMDNLDRRWVGYAAGRVGLGGAALFAWGFSVRKAPLEVPPEP
jgi:MFS family permease